MINKYPQTGFTAFSKSLEVLFSDGGEIWLKVSHNIFYKGIVDNDNGNLKELYSTKGNGIERVADNKIDNGYEYLRSLSESKEGGVFFIPAKPKGAPVKECVKVSDLLSCEMDGGTTEEQWERLNYFTEKSGLIFGAIIGSGGKSLHGHIVLTSQIGIDTRTHWQRLLAIAMLSDPAVINPHQPMRLPGFFRKEKNREQTLESYSESQYNHQEIWEGFRKFFDAEGYQFFTSFTSERWAKLYKIVANKDGLTVAEQKAEIKRILSLSEEEINPPRQIYPTENFTYSGDVIPLEFFLCKKHQDYIQTGLPAGSEGRNPTAFTLSQVLQALEASLTALGIQYSSDSYHLVSNFGARCTPPINVDDAYKNAKKYPLHIDEEDINRKVSYWEYSNNSQSQPNPTPNQNSQQSTPLQDKDWQAKRDYAAKKQWQNNKKYTPDITYSEKFCKSPNAPKQGEIVCLKYHTGQGKSTKIKSWFTNELKDLGAIKLGSRNSLEYQFAASSDFSHLKDDGQLFIVDPKGRTTSCIDSILKYDDDDFDGKVLVLDEIESVARHTLNGGTLKERQQQAIDKLKIALQRCHSVILADGNLSDNVCNFIQKLSGKKLIKYYNDVIPSRPTVIFYDDIERKSSEKLAHQIKGEAFPWVMFDSQIDCEAMQKDLLIYGRKPLRIDSKSINDPILGKEIKRFLSNPDLFLTENEQSKTYDCILSTPTIESGLDVNWGGFSGIYLLPKHLEINHLLQMIARPRALNIPVYACAPTYVKNNDESVTKSPFIKTLSAILNDLQKSSVAALGGELGKHEDEILKALHCGVEQAYNTPENELFNIFQVIKNYEHSNYRECLIESLKLSGYNVTFAQIGQAVATQFKECKKEVKESVASDIATADDIDQQTFERLSKRQDLKWDDRCSVTKYRFKQRLTGIDSVGGLTKDLVFHLLHENKKLISQAEIRWMMSHPELAIKRSKKAWHGVLKFNKTFLGNFKTLLPLIKELNRLNVPQLMDKLCTIYYNSEYQDIKDLWKSWGRVQVSRTGIERGATPVMLIKRLAAKLGYEPTETGAVNINGNTRMNYILNDLLLDPYGLIVSHCVDERLENENLDPGIGDDDWLEILQSKSLHPIQGIASTDLKRTDNTIDINVSVLNPSNLDSVSDSAIPDVEKQQSDHVPEKLCFNQLKQGDILFDAQGTPHQLIKPCGAWGWETHRKTHISRNDILQGEYHPATVQDVAELIKQSIKNNNHNQAMWIDKHFGQGNNSLMSEAMLFDEECCGIYDLMDLVG